MDSAYSFRFPKGGMQLQVVAKAINQGIDSRLNAVFFSQDDSDEWFVDIGIDDTKSLVVLMYRLWEEGQEDDGEESEDLFSAICDTLGLEDPWLVDNDNAVMPDLYYSCYEKTGQFVGPLDKVVAHCLKNDSVPTGIMMQA